MLTSVFKKISSVSGTNTIIPNVVDSHEWYRSHLLHILPYGSHIWVTGLVPILPKTKIKKAVMIKSLPMKVGGYWLQFDLDSMVLLTIGDEDRSSVISEAEYTACKQEPFSVCSLHPLIRKWNTNACVHSLINEHLVGISDCKIAVLPSHMSFKGCALPVKQNS